MAQERTRRVRARGGVRPIEAATDCALHGPAPAPERQALRFSLGQWRQLSALYGVVALLHACGGGLLFYYARHFPALLGLGFAAYLLGLRHAFDADHIAAIDDTVRYLLQKRKQPLGVGLYFSLGHSTVVLIAALALIGAASLFKRDLPELRSVGALVGAGVSGLFLWLIGILNLLVLLDIIKVWRQARSGAHGHAHLETVLAQRGLINRLFGGRLQRLMSASWQMYPLGLLFGFGFDTASEVALLAMTAGASAGELPLPAALSLPLLFAAGMSLMDTTDGVLMVKAYGWAWVNPLRKVFYNLTTTSLSVAVALLMGSIELLQVCIGVLDLKGPLSERMGSIDMSGLGLVIVGLFLAIWGLSVALWKSGLAEPRSR